MDTHSLVLGRDDRARRSKLRAFWVGALEAPLNNAFSVVEFHARAILQAPWAA
jgi:hypothetical protein